MTVFKPKDCRTYRYSFYVNKTRYTGSTKLAKKKAADKFVERMREQLELEAAGLATPPPPVSPRFSDWAEVYYAHAAKTVTRPERIFDLLKVILRFWGEPPSGTDPTHPRIEGEPYHNLRLHDAITRPEWIAEFEDWMDRRGVAGQTKNQYRSALRQMYRLALQPRWRATTGIQTNPIDGIYRDRPGQRDVTITREELRAILSRASYHVRLAIAIGALAPKLRLDNILSLQWTVNVDRSLSFITVYEHKTAAKTTRPLVTPISAQLRAILEDARRRSASPCVVTYKTKPIHSIRGGVAAAVRAAGLPYGRARRDGITFHTLRHTAATILAELDVSEGKRKAVMGHRHVATTQKYTHLRPVHERDPIERLSSELRIDDLVMQPWRRASRKPVQKPVQPADDEPGSSQTRPLDSAHDWRARKRR